MSKILKIRPINFVIVRKNSFLDREALNLNWFEKKFRTTMISNRTYNNAIREKIRKEITALKLEFDKTGSLDYTTIEGKAVKGLGITTRYIEHESNLSLKAAILTVEASTLDGITPLMQLIGSVPNYKELNKKGGEYTYTYLPGPYFGATQIYNNLDAYTVRIGDGVENGEITSKTVPSESYVLHDFSSFNSSVKAQANPEGWRPGEKLLWSKVKKWGENIRSISDLKTLSIPGYMVPQITEAALKVSPGSYNRAISNDGKTAVLVQGDPKKNIVFTQFSGEMARHLLGALSWYSSNSNFGETIKYHTFGNRPFIFRDEDRLMRFDISHEGADCGMLVVHVSKFKIEQAGSEYHATSIDFPSAHAKTKSI